MLGDDQLPIHAVTHLRALGVLPSGRVVWPVIGAAEDGGDGGGSGDGDDGKDEGKAAGDGDGAQGDEKLGDPGKQALARERQARKDAEKQLREAQAKLKGYTDKDASAEQKLADLQRESAERQTKLTRRAVGAEVRALAAATYADPADAAAFLDLARYAGDDGEIDTEAITADLAELLERKPHLKAKRGPRPDPSQGGSGGSGGTPNLQQQISDAEKKGDVAESIRLKNILLVEQARK